MTYGHSKIMEHYGTFDQSNDMEIINKILWLWENFKRKRLLKSFDEVEPNVFVLKQEIVNRIKLKSKKIRYNHLKNKNNK